MIKAFKVFVKNTAALLWKGMVNSWCMSPGRTSAHTIRYVRNVYKDVTFSEKCRHIPLSLWSETFCGHFYGMDVERRLALSTSYQEFSVNK